MEFVGEIAKKATLMLYDVYENNVYVGRMTAKEIARRYQPGKSRPSSRELKKMGITFAPSGKSVAPDMGRASAEWCAEWDKWRKILLKNKKEQIEYVSVSKSETINNVFRQERY